MIVDTGGFRAEMEGQKRRSREARLESNGAAGGVRLELTAEQTSWLVDAGIATTDDAAKPVWDKSREANGKAVFTSGGFLEEGEVAKEGTTVGMVLDMSSFYADSGGQDTNLGTISLEGGGDLSVDDVQLYSGYILHSGVVSGGLVSIGSTVTCRVDYARRRDIAPNHSMTHVLNDALRKVLGEGCAQRGSQCNKEKLRVNFSHKSDMTPALLRDMETYVDERIRISPCLLLGDAAVRGQGHPRDVGRLWRGLP